VKVVFCAHQNITYDAARGSLYCLNPNKVTQVYTTCRTGTYKNDNGASSCVDSDRPQKAERSDCRRIAEPKVDPKVQTTEPDFLVMVPTFLGSS
jgi:hypothetical protein